MPYNNGSEAAGERTPLLESQPGAFVEDVETQETCCDSIQKSISSCCKYIVPLSIVYYEGPQLGVV